MTRADQRTATAAISGVDPASYRSAMRLHAGAVSIISSGRPGRRTGLTATAVCSLSDSPPRLIVCVNRSASAHDLIRQTGAFGVNMLGADQAELAGRFAGRRGLEGEERFTDVDAWTLMATGAPILKNAIASFDCELLDQHAYETHTIFIGGVRALRAGGDENPLIYLAGCFRRLAT